MRSSYLTGAILASGVLLACEPELEQKAPPDVVVARFDPSAATPVVPKPNDLAFNPATGRLNVTPDSDASPADLEFVSWLNTLNGFPAATTASATFTGELDEASATPAVTPVVDMTDGMTAVSGIALKVGAPAASAGEDAKAQLSISAPPVGWTPGHTYAVAILGGDHGLKAKGGKQVVGSATWAFIRSAKSLVTCTDLTSPDCRSTTEVIPSAETDPALRVKDQAAKAVLLEKLRLKYKPAIDALVANGTAREDIALLWTFKVHDGPIALFNPAASPPQVPVPNDLAIDRTTGLVNAPIDPNAPLAQQEFTRDYLNTLDGFPVTANADAVIIAGALDPATVNAQTVMVLDLAAAPGDGPVGATIAYAPSSLQNGGHLVLSPPSTGWLKGHQYAVAITTHATTPDGVPLAASDAWALARNSQPLVDCEDLTSADCHSVLKMAPLTDAQAVGLEGLRRAYRPVLDALEAKGLPREEVALLWTYKIVSLPEATFDPGNGIVPFPNNLLLDPTTGKVKLPVPAGASPLLEQLIGGLNTLDGFSTVGPFVSENSDGLGALDRGSIDAASLTAGTGFVPLAGAVTAPQVTACLDCMSSLLPDGTNPDAPQQLQFVTHVPLDERATYAAFLTDGLKDTSGKKVVAAPAFALIRMANPLVDGNGTSLVSGVADEDAQQLEPVRQGMKPLLDALAAQDLPRKSVALAWAFKTQTAKTGLEQLNDAPTALGAMGLSSSPLYTAEVTAQVLPTLAVPKDKIGKIFMGHLLVPYLLTGPGTTLNPTAPDIRKAPFTLILPDEAQVNKPATGWPVVIFGHGLGRNRNDVFAFANSLAATGQAVIAIDHVFHGDRATCVGSAAVTGAGTDDAACANPAAQTCSASTGRCVARDPATRLSCAAGSTGGYPADLFCTQAGQGVCVAADQKCEGGDFLRDSSGAVRISGNAFLDTVNLFGTRDHFRAPVADLAQLVRVIEGGSTGDLNQQLVAQGAGPLDTAMISYAGQSLGGIVGTLFTAASPTIVNSVLNVPGADLAEVMLTAPAFTAQKDAFIGGLAAQGITQGTPAFDNFIGIAKWILGPSDPQNAGYEMLNGARAPSSRSVFLSYIEGDTVIPNPTTELLISATNRSGGEQSAIKKYLSTMAANDRHGFLLNFKDAALTMTAQAEAAAFLLTGTTP